MGFTWIWASILTAGGWYFHAPPPSAIAADQFGQDPRWSEAASRKSVSVCPACCTGAWLSWVNECSGGCHGVQWAGWCSEAAPLLKVRSSEKTPDIDDDWCTEKCYWSRSQALKQWWFPCSARCLHAKWSMVCCSYFLARCSNDWVIWRRWQMMTASTKLVLMVKELFQMSCEVKGSKDLGVESVIIPTTELHWRERKHAHWIATCLSRSKPFLLDGDDV